MVFIKNILNCYFNLKTFPPSAQCDIKKVRVVLPPNKLLHNENANFTLSKALRVYCQGIQLVCHRYSKGEETPNYV